MSHTHTHIYKTLCIHEFILSSLYVCDLYRILAWRAAKRLGFGRDHFWRHALHLCIGTFVAMLLAAAQTPYEWTHLPARRFCMRSHSEWQHYTGHNRDDNIGFRIGWVNEIYVIKKIWALIVFIYLLATCSRFAAIGATLHCTPNTTLPCYW